MCDFIYHPLQCYLNYLNGPYDGIELEDVTEEGCDVCRDGVTIGGGSSRTENLASAVRRSRPLSAAHSYIPASTSVTL